MTADDGDDTRHERHALADTFLALGPDAPTLCEGWRTRDLAAHLVLRESRPDATAGIVLRQFAGHTARVQAALAAGPYPELVERIRTPTGLSWARIRPLDRLVNPLELFVHHEDARRAQPQWRARPLSHRVAITLWLRTRSTSRLALRRFPARVTIDPVDFDPITVGADGPALRLTGEPGELAMFLGGRQRAADVTLTGPPELVTRLREQPIGF